MFNSGLTIIMLFIIISHLKFLTRRCKMKKKDVQPKARNFVAKNAHLCNKSAVFTDRKKRERAGYSKHKGFFE